MATDKCKIVQWKSFLKPVYLQVRIICLEKARENPLRRGARGLVSGALTISLLTTAIQYPVDLWHQLSSYPAGMRTVTGCLKGV